MFVTYLVVPQDDYTPKFRVTVSQPTFNGRKEEDVD